MKRWSLALIGMLAFGCGGGDGDGGPTGPRPPANVQGLWNATATSLSITDGLLCVRDSLPRPVGASITQNGPSIALNLTFSHNFTCSFSGTVSGTAISWTLDPQQTASSCRPYTLSCNNPDGTARHILVSEIRSGSFNGSVSGDQIAVSGEIGSTVRSAQTGALFPALSVSTSIVLQRQR